MNGLPVFIGYDSAQDVAYQVASSSASAYGDCVVLPLVLSRLRTSGIYTRPTTVTPQGLRDDISNAPMSTEFALSRFLVPMLAHRGPALFVDSDVVFLAPPSSILLDAPGWEKYAVSVVKHEHKPSRATKMGGAEQTHYPRKNWSSVMLFNTEHPAWSTFSLRTFNALRGRDLHRFAMLSDGEVGALPANWNWLVGEQEEPVDLSLAHYTLGGPWLPHRDPADIVTEADALWIASRDLYLGESNVP